MTPSLAAFPFRWISVPLFRWSIGIITCVILALWIFNALGLSVLTRVGMPHEVCYLRDPSLVRLHVVSDLLIGFAYVSISATLGYLVFKASKGIPFHGVFLAFGLFIVSCGMTHFMEVWVIWEPVYWLSGFIKVVTAAASLATAVSLFPLLPKVFRLIAEAQKSEARRIEIEQLNRELERFNYSVAHDLRGPLRGISGFTAMLGKECGESLSPLGKNHIDRVQQSVLRMDNLIADLLKYASIGRKELALHPVELEQPLQEALALLDNEIRQRNAKIVISKPLPRVIGDITLLQVVFQNLIGNAIKFVPAEVSPLVEITWKSEPENVVVFLTDNGLGIPVEHHQSVFKIFQRFHPSHPGTGIGLPIVHRAIERLQGKIGLSESHPGSGAQFWIRLPAA